MNYKPDDATLVAYHYGELDGEELKKVEEFLLQNPSERKRMEEWRQARGVMAHLLDKEVIAPPIILGDTQQRPFWREGYFRMSMGIAASFLVVLVAARLLGFNATYKAGELTLGFGSRSSTEQEVPLSKATVEKMIQTSLAANSTALQEAWGDDRKRLEESIQKNIDYSSSRINRLVKEVSSGQQEQVRQFVGQLRTDNLKLMQDYMQLSAAGQKEYIETLLVDFSKYVQEQRRQDLQDVQTSMTSIQENTDQFKKETEQLLTSLITNRTDNQRSN